MRLEATGMGHGVLGQGGGGADAWVLAQGGTGQGWWAPRPSPALPSPGSACLLQTKNMDYYKREVSGARGGGGSRGARAAGHP